MKNAPARNEPVSLRLEPDNAKALNLELEKRPGVVRTFVLNEVLRIGFKAKGKMNGKQGN